MVELLNPSTDTKVVKCQLEYLFFRAGFFFLSPINITKHHISLNHLNLLLPLTEKSKRCNVCVSVRNRRSASTSGLRRVGKALALGIWEEGRPIFTWALYGQLIWVTCRHLYEKKYLNDEMKKRSDQLFGK